MIKVNELSKELLKKGMAHSSDEALKMAESYLQKDALPQKNPQTVQSDEKNDILIERLQRKLQNELSGMQERLNMVTHELQMVKDELKRLRAAPNPTKQESPQKIVQEEPKQEVNQRTGGLKPGDVNIGDYFNYGKK